jgi:hypothetical protein
VCHALHCNPENGILVDGHTRYGNPHTLGCLT